MGLLALKGLMVVYHALVEPALAISLRRTRLASFDARRDPVAISLSIGQDSGCSSACDHARKPENPVAPRYLLRARRPSDGWGRRALHAIERAHKPTPMIVDLDRYPDMRSFEATLRKRSSRTLAKVRRAAEAGYRVRVFSRPSHALDVYAIRTSKPFRSGGPVFDVFLLRPEDMGRTRVHSVPETPRCPRHWTRWWGVFRSAPGDSERDVASREELVAYVQLRRIGDMVHYVDIMGHADHLAHNVMILLHVEIMRWLIARDGHAAGVRVVLYGGLEHGREGLLTWKKRAGFEPTLLVRGEDATRRT